MRAQSRVHDRSTSRDCRARHVSGTSRPRSRSEPYPYSRMDDRHRPALIRRPLADMPGAKGGDIPQHAIDAASIPHDVENRRVETGSDPERNPQFSCPFPPHRRSRNRPGSTSQGGDTGSNHVGTTSVKPQVRRLLLNRSAGLNRDSNAEYPENIPSGIERSDVP